MYAQTLFLVLRQLRGSILIPLEKYHDTFVLLVSKYGEYHKRIS